MTELLGVNDGEIDFGYNNNSHTIFIYDTALGGAGYSPLFREYKDSILRMAYDALRQCDCERACTKCLIDRRSQWYLNYLNRQKALDWLQMELKSRTAPESIITLVPDATSVTTDFATELYQLSRNKDIRSMSFFINSNYSEWQVSEFPYNRLLNELIVSGVDTTFILDKPIDFTGCESAERATLLSALFRYKFGYYTDALPNTLSPVLTVTFNDGKTKTYFGENVSTSLSDSWGRGDIYSTMNGRQIEFNTINVVDLVQSVSEGDGSIMFDLRLNKDCAINTLFDTLINNKTDKWAGIRNTLHGKTVLIEYSDRYLYTPLGCMLLAHFISSLKQDFGINITSINISVTKPTSNDSIFRDSTKICENFRSSDSRNSFIEDAIEEVVGIKPIVNDNGFIHHERCLTVKTNSMELCIRPDAGIAYGWKPDGRDNIDCTDEDFRYNWDLEMDLYNQRKRYDGILYTISFNNI